jgi:hypothetical protein
MSNNGNLPLFSKTVYSFSSRHDLLHVEAHGKNWRAATYADEGEAAENEAWIGDVKNAR